MTMPSLGTVDVAVVSTLLGRVRLPANLAQNRQMIVTRRRQVDETTLTLTLTLTQWPYPNPNPNPNPNPMVLP